jgi:hypothetical protein
LKKACTDEPIPLKALIVAGLGIAARPVQDEIETCCARTPAPIANVAPVKSTRSNRTTPGKPAGIVMVPAIVQSVITR